MGNLSNFVDPRLTVVAANDYVVMTDIHHNNPAEK